MLTRRAVLSEVLAQWRMYTMSVLLAGFRAEAGRLGELLKTKKNDIWSMRKEELISIAVTELDISKSEASTMTVVVLRERIRRARAERTEAADETLMIRKGLEKKTQVELQVECQFRGIDVLGPGGKPKTRAAMIIDIREYVQVQQQEQQRQQLQQTRASSSTSRRRTRATSLTEPEMMETDWTFEK